MKKIVINKAISDNDFVGIKLEPNIVNITFPVGYRIDEKSINIPSTEIVEYISDIKILTRCLDLSYMNYYDEGTQKFNFSSAMYIIEYYLKYGLYKENSNQNLLNMNGKINWKKTINNVEPICYNNNIIYSDLYTKSNISEENNITIIQKYCYNASKKIIGWYYGLDYTDNKEIHLSNNEMLYFLNKELYAINDDNKKSIIKEMINFISGTDISKILSNSEITIGRHHFDKVWENLLRKQLFQLFKEYNCLPNTYYVDKNGNKICNSDLYPDMVVIEKDNIIIIDAKYYKIGFLPASSDICKQLFYEQYIKHKNKNCKIINIFLLPNSLKEEFEYYGYACAEHSKNEKVITYYIDTKSVLKDNQALSKLMELLLK